MERVHPTHPRRSRLTAAALAVAGCATALAASAPASPAAATVPAPAAATEPCGRTPQILAATLAELHADPAAWSIGDADGAYGLTTSTRQHTGRTIVSDRAPCSAVPSIVHHEWIHQLQLHRLGAAQMVADGFRTELVADCGSWLLGSTYTPYVAMARRTGGAGCTAPVLADARALIAGAGVAL